ncbi:hypothetical protein [Rhizobium sp. 42MFCr.1]|uniref:hypothetical protein n=1 Tax=Rhizobium sp. 42MFCr.1 TaxID=1048680 RepID=UPI000367AC0F|nr:hypothetical protein [Rhizobium sp. 42MFCr.1]
MRFTWRIPVTALILGLISIPATAKDRLTGNSTVKWEQGQSCGDGHTCFDIHQHGSASVSLFHPCPQRQILTTTITGVPETVHKFDVLSAAGFWQFGIDKVEFVTGTIVIRTFVIQNHSSMYCLSPGQGDFKLAFY